MHPARASVLARTGVSEVSPPISTVSSHLLPSLKYPRRCQNSPRDALSLSATSVCSLLSAHESAARMLLCSLSNRSNHAAWRGPLSSSSASSANPRNQEACRRRVASASSLTLRSPSPYLRTGSRILYRSAPSGSTSVVTNDLPTSSESRSKTSSSSMLCPVPTASAAPIVQ